MSVFKTFLSSFYCEIFIFWEKLGMNANVGRVSCFIFQEISVIVIEFHCQQFIIFSSNRKVSFLVRAREAIINHIAP
jgi:hypothetical protein